MKAMDGVQIGEEEREKTYLRERERERELSRKWSSEVEVTKV